MPILKKLKLKRKNIKGGCFNNPLLILTGILLIAVIIAILYHYFYKKSKKIERFYNEGGNPATETTPEITPEWEPTEDNCIADNLSEDQILKCCGTKDNIIHLKKGVVDQCFNLLDDKEKSEIFCDYGTGIHNANPSERNNKCCTHLKNPNSEFCTEKPTAPTNTAPTNTAPTTSVWEPNKANCEVQDLKKDKDKLLRCCNKDNIKYINDTSLCYTLSETRTDSPQKNVYCDSNISFIDSNLVRNKNCCDFFGDILQTPNNPFCVKKCQEIKDDCNNRTATVAKEKCFASNTILSKKLRCDIFNT